MLRALAKLFGMKPSSPQSGLSSTEERESYTLRMGKVVRTDKVFEAWTSGSLPAMLKVLDHPTNPIDRHLLLMSIVNLTYTNRSDQDSRCKCREVAELHLQEMPTILPALKKDMDGELPRISTFQHYATVLTEDGDYQRAIDVCQSAIDYGLDDGTKGGYPGRIERIRKKVGQTT